MRVLLDGKMIGTSETLGEALALAVQTAGSRLVVAASADGHQVPQDDLEHPPEQGDYAQELTVTTAEPGELVAGALNHAADALGELGPEQSAVAELIQVGETEEAMSRLSKLVGVWQQVDQTMNLAQQAMGAKVSSSSFAEAALELTTHLSAVRDALQAGDLTTVADTLAYDMDGLPERWSMLLRTVADELDEVCAAQAG